MVIYSFFEVLEIEWFMVNWLGVFKVNIKIFGLFVKKVVGFSYVDVCCVCDDVVKKVVFIGFEEIMIGLFEYVIIVR